MIKYLWRLIIRKSHTLLNYWVLVDKFLSAIVDKNKDPYMVLSNTFFILSIEYGLCKY